MDIYVENLRKTYMIPKKNPGLKESIRSLFRRELSAIDAVKDISFTIKSGEVVGFIGSNGSGKTTTLKMLSGLLHPTAGKVQIGSYIPSERKNSFLRQIGFVMGQKGQLWWDLPALDSYDLLIDIYECDHKETMSYVQQMAEELDIEDCLKQPIRMLSLGQRMKAELIGAILHRPLILLLDEPTIGLDICSARAIRKIIKEEASRRGMIIMLSSHILDDIQEVCKRVIIIDKGNLVYNNLLENCYQKYMFKKSIQVKFVQPIQREDLLYPQNISLYSPYEVSWEVDRNLIPKVSYEIMQNYFIEDITISEVSLSSVIEFITNERKK